MARNNLISLLSVKQQLRACGYSGSLVQENYIYKDSIGAHEVPLACFSSSVYDSRTSCISVLRHDNIQDVTEKFVNNYREIGTPVAFVCGQKAVQWWRIGAKESAHIETIPNENIQTFFNKHQKELTPKRIWRAKNLGRLDRNQQLHFVDIGLMPLLEHEMGERLGELMNRVLDLLRDGFTKKQLNKNESQRWIFKAGFWFLCAKILQDKDVNGFKRLDLNNIDNVFKKVNKHYGAGEQVAIGTDKQQEAAIRAADEIFRFSSLKNLTTEAFGYMYENVLVSDELRDALGIHATPSYLVDYIVWQLWPWIQQIPEDKRIVLEPACGHSPFLTGTMRVLREIFEGDEKDFHTYAKKKLIGLEVDSFAREIARLSLTLADVPNSNGWNIIEADVFHGDLLSQRAKSTMILLSNPPFENFTKEEKKRYGNVETGNKAAEILSRTLYYMPENSVFGIVLPQGFLHRNNLIELRKYILDNFELQKILTLPDNVFAKAGHPSAILLGRKSKSKEKVSYVRVPKSKLLQFKNNYKAKEEILGKSVFYREKNYSFRIVELRNIWGYCKEQGYPALKTYAEIGRGIEYKDVKKSIQKTRFAGAVKGYAKFEKTITKAGKRKKVDIELTDLPDEFWMCTKAEEINNWRYGYQPGIPQILMNYARSGSHCWRIKGLIDTVGHPIYRNFLTLRLNLESYISLNLVWAIINSPFANAYMFCNCMERHNLEGILRDMPTPFHIKHELSKLEGMVKQYFDLTNRSDLEAGFNVRYAAKELLLSIDAEVMRLYDLPPRYEKRILDLFQGVQRKGVDFEFTGYYPEGFESAIPLHVFLSEEYQNSTFENVNKWVEKNRSDEVIKAFEEAVDAFQDK